MISLDQVQLLDKKVATMVARMNELQRQNEQFRIQLNDYASKNQDLIAKNESLNAANQVLQQKIATFASDQVKIEQGILNALEKLNSMENDETNSSPLQQTESEAIDFGSEQTDFNIGNENTETISSNDEIEPVSEQGSLENTAKSSPNGQIETSSSVQDDGSAELNLEDDVFSFLSFDDENSENSNADNSSENKPLDDIF